ncbi:hypothetical protein BJ742DRAFT_746713 [Cladochytrium replicatum]|nr:hypothetical protein BJ742DRAFT_746713 [Cladochytrium replicatum]
MLLVAWLLESKRPDPAAAAESLIKLFPGENLAAKSSSVLLFSSIAAFLISKEIYVIDLEFFEMLCIFGAYYIWYSASKEGVKSWFTEKKETTRRVLEQARSDHKAVVKERIEHISKMSDAAEVTQGLFAISKEIAHLEAEAYQLKQKVQFTNEVKSVLDAWVRHEANIREQEQKQLATAVIEKIKEKLNDPKTQLQLLNESISEIESKS